jgi:hypothetical protein
MGGITAGEWLGVVHDLGSNAFGSAKIQRMPLWYQLAADVTLIGAEHITLRPGTARVRSGCTPVGSGPREESVTPGTVLHITSDARDPITLKLRRISKQFPSQPQLRLAPRGSADVLFPKDADSADWRLSISTAGASSGGSGTRAAVCLATSVAPAL